ncbi:hypothetical protein PGT21_003315 [Puccinia graminis f. sp. tritici]|uniref:Uncharacterized protein n=1 Tax=Puccinia graminis f. sp. tritici TaxID=56615 RepID=A0A5B0MDZ3_PUCGR|nr:hypothetical protein PGTUg99_033087 [Puccinia graminis f. sp. tritici]KAA1090496.1 hypothetical protein PGT21_003315 [Puccinia graminis f. sp. tritici]
MSRKFGRIAQIFRNSCRRSCRRVLSMDAKTIWALGLGGKHLKQSAAPMFDPDSIGNSTQDTNENEIRNKCKTLGLRNLLRNPSESISQVLRKAFGIPFARDARLSQSFSHGIA